MLTTSLWAHSGPGVRAQSGAKAAADGPRQSTSNWVQAPVTLNIEDMPQAPTIGVDG